MPSNQSKEHGDSIKNYNVYQQLGKGGFAQVYRAEVKETLQEVAIKIVSFTPFARSFEI
jgi:serine/threonine protein kinase